MSRPADVPPILARRMGKGRQPDLCQWFAFCDQPHVGTVDHPTLGDVPCCERCAEKLDLDLITHEAREAAQAADIADGYDPTEPWMEDHLT